MKDTFLYETFKPANGTYILFKKVSEGEVFLGQQKGPLKKLLVVFALLP